MESLGTKKSNFPLYDELKRETDNLPSDKKKDHKWEEDVKGLQQLPLEANEILFALIYYHFIITDGKKKKSLPYGIKYIDGQKGAIINWTLLPSDLQLIHSLYREKIGR